MANVGFIGLGAMGKPMARNLLAAGHNLFVHNRSRPAIDELVAAGAGAGGSAAGVAARAEICFVCVPDSPDLELVVTGPGGILEGARDGLIIVDCTSADPAVSRPLARACAARNVILLDAPVSGGTAGAEKGTLTMMVGGDEAALARALPVMRAVGKKIVHVGPSGSGHALKALNNTLLAVNLWAAAEALVAAARAGIPAASALEVINASSGRSNATENLIPDRVVTRKFPVTFKLGLLAKDVGIGVNACRAAGVASPVIDLVGALFRAANREVGADEDHTACVKLVERLSGVEIR